MQKKKREMDFPFEMDSNGNFHRSFNSETDDCMSNNNHEKDNVEASSRSHVDIVNIEYGKQIKNIIGTSREEEVSENGKKQTIKEENDDGDRRKKQTMTMMDPTNFFFRRKSKPCIKLQIKRIDKNSNNNSNDDDDNDDDDDKRNNNNNNKVVTEEEEEDEKNNRKEDSIITDDKIVNNNADYFNIIKVLIKEDDVDCVTLRAFASRPGGFLTNTIRYLVWPKLLNINRFELENSSQYKFPDQSKSTIKFHNPFHKLLFNNKPQHPHPHPHDKKKKFENRRNSFSHFSSSKIHPTEIEQVQQKWLQKAKEDQDTIQMDCNRAIVQFSSHHQNNNNHSANNQKNNKNQNHIPPPQVATTKKEKGEIRERLIKITSAVIVKHSNLYYYQGYHDIVSVLLLVLDGDEDLAFAVAEKISLYYIPDFMNPNFDTVIFILDLLFPLLQVYDEELYDFMVNKAQCPNFFALSWILTWFSHDVENITVVARIFDLLLSSHPLLPLYLSVGVLRNRRYCIMKQECDMGILHEFLQKELNNCDFDTITIAALEMFNNTPPAMLVTINEDFAKTAVKLMPKILNYPNFFMEISNRSDWLLAKQSSEKLENDKKYNNNVGSPVTIDCKKGKSHNNNNNLSKSHNHNNNSKKINHTVKKIDKLLNTIIDSEGKTNDSSCKNKELNNVNEKRKSIDQYFIDLPRRLYKIWRE